MRYSDDEDENIESEDDESIENTDYHEDIEIFDDEGEMSHEDLEAHDESDDNAGPASSRRRAWVLLFIVLILSVLLVGMLLATRPIPAPPPTMKPPWMV